MPIERMTAEEYREYERARREGERKGMAEGHQAGWDAGLREGQRREQLTRDPAPPAPWSAEAVAWMLICRQIAKDMPAVSEEDVSAECQAVMRELGGLLLEHYTRDDVHLHTGDLVYVTSEHRGKPKGISKGWPDWHIWRVGCWKEGVELKARERGGRPGAASPEQKTALSAGLYWPVWAGEHLRVLIEKLDRQAGWAGAVSATEES